MFDCCVSYFQHVLRVLKPGGTVVINGSKSEPFARALLFGGFTEMHVVESEDDDLNVQVKNVVTSSTPKCCVVTVCVCVCPF